jgi:hypothetical protein
MREISLSKSMAMAKRFSEFPLSQQNTAGKEVGVQMVTYSALFAYSLVLIGVANLILQIVQICIQLRKKK